jgi:hypothetical protein
MIRPCACSGVTSPYPTVVTVWSANHSPLPIFGYSWWSSARSEDPASERDQERKAGDDRGRSSRRKRIVQQQTGCKRNPLGLVRTARRSHRLRTLELRHLVPSSLVDRLTRASWINRHMAPRHRLFRVSRSRLHLVPCAEDDRRGTAHRPQHEGPAGSQRDPSIRISLCRSDEHFVAAGDAPLCAASSSSSRVPRRRPSSSRGCCVGLLIRPAARASRARDPPRRRGGPPRRRSAGMSARPPA